jgi:hypothetical protein
MLTRFTTIPSLKELHSRYECENQICGRNYLDYRLWHIATEYSSPAIIQHWQSTLSKQPVKVSLKQTTQLILALKL